MALSVRFGVLGPLVAEDASGRLDIKGPRHRAVLARLLIERGRVVPVDRLVNDLWDDPPAGAVGAVQTFVSALRRALEPDRAPRSPAELLVTMGPGYVLRADRDAVDAWRFEAAVDAGGALLAQHRADAALAHLDLALSQWHGPAYAEFETAAWARPEISRLDDLHLLAAERRAEAMLDLGRAAAAVPDLELLVDGHSWRESGWRLLALALYQSGRQGDALGALRRARRILAADLGVDPGPELRRVESDILAHASHLDPAGSVGTRAIPTQAIGTQAIDSEPADRRRSTDRQLVGRADEMAQLADAAANAVADARLRLGLISGDAGAGKTALADSFTNHLASQGWTTAWGANPDDNGTPAAWGWSQILDSLAANGHGAAPAPDSGTAADPAVVRFRWHRAVGSYLAAAARRAPLLLILDDVHEADPETTDLLAALTTERLAAPILIVATYRTTDLPAALIDVLGRVARYEPTRVYLGGLPSDDVARLVRTVTGSAVDPDTAALIHQRSGGNPFFVRELARLLDTEGPDIVASVPPGVRDVVRYRMAKLSEAAQAILRPAAVIGMDVDLELLAALAGHDVLDAVEDAARSGFLIERGPQRFRFAHALVRDTLHHDISRSRRSGWHAATAEAIERLRPSDVDALAHHYLLAESAATAPKAARYARAAAERAEDTFAPHDAVRAWRAALTANDRAGNGDIRVRLDLIMGLVRALALTGDLAGARQRRGDALALAEELDDPAVIAGVIAGFDVPAIWTDNDDPSLADRIVRLTERTLATLPADKTAERSRLLATLALELRNTAGERERAAAYEAETTARALNDPALLAFALNARFMQSFERAGLAPQRDAIGAEILELAARHELVTFAVLGHLIRLQSGAALADFVSADHHADAADELGERYRIPLIGVFTGWYRALRAAVAGRSDDAEAGYRSAAARLSGTGMAGLDDGVLALALFCHQIQLGHPLDAELAADFGSYEPWCRPLIRLAAGRLDEAGPAAADIPDSPRDLLYEARTCLHAMTAIALGDAAVMESRYADLLPASGEIAGAGSGLLTLRPVAHYLGDLAAALGRRQQAADHYRQAIAIATQAGAQHWADAARTILDDLR